MALSRQRRRPEPINYWPGFVDALSTMLLVFIFLLSVFVMAQYFLSRDVGGKDAELVKLNRQIEELSALLSLEKTGKAEAAQSLASLSATLEATRRERDALMAASAGGVPDAPADAKKLSEKAQATVDLLNQQIAALRAQLAAVQEALSAQEAKNKNDQARISDLGARLNVALAQKVQELARYRSDFFGRLREILGDRRDVKVVGDRFVLPSEVLFDTGQASLTAEGRAELDKISRALTDLQKEIPPEIPWVLRVDGHTDKRPIASPQFKSNWELSAARSIAVVQYLVAKSFDPHQHSRRRLWRAAAHRRGRQRGRLAAQPPHRIEDHRPMTAKLRCYRAEDWPEVLALWVETWTFSRPEIDFSARAPWLEELFARSLAEGAQIVVAEDASGLVGFVLFDPAKKWLEQIAVRPRLFGLGIGRQLIARAKAECPEGFGLTVNTDNHRALAYYRLQGFVRESEGVNPLSGLPILTLMWRPLSLDDGTTKMETSGT